MKKLQVIEDKSFEMGNIASQSFNENGNGASLRFAVMSYRCSMQAIRDQARYKITIPVKRKKK